MYIVVNTYVYIYIYTYINGGLGVRVQGLGWSQTGVSRPKHHLNIHFEAV